MEKATEIDETHTPGPWTYSKVKDDHVVHGPEGDCIAWCNGVRAPNAANGRLIASAPELLKAAKAAYRLYCLVGYDRNERRKDQREAENMLRTAIHKAEKGA